jgi:hypothetical protein
MGRPGSRIITSPFQRILLAGLLLGVMVNPVPALIDQPLEEILAKSQSEGKHLYVAFLGIDWSLSSKRFKERILESAEFKELARRRLLYFPVEARRKPALSKEETARLQSWVIHFDVKSYPTVILLAPDGEEVLRHTYRDIEALEYVKLLETILPADLD